jgi:hypothetical protein
MAMAVSSDRIRKLKEYNIRNFFNNWAKDRQNITMQFAGSVAYQFGWNLLTSV